MTITARYPATCPSCSQPIAIGASVEWSKGAKARHTSCSTSAPAAATPRTSSARYGSYRTIGARMAARQRATGWTGCACGSIEGRERASDCATCQHDY